MIPMLAHPFFRNRIVLLGTAAVVGAGIVFSFGYLKGYGSAEEKAQANITKALEEQQTRLLAMARDDRERAIALVRGEQKTRNQFREIRVPVNTDCDSDLWLQSFNAAVRLANRAGTATGSSPNARGKGSE